MTASLFSDVQLLPDGTALVAEAGGEAEGVLWLSEDLGRTLRPLLHRRVFRAPVKLYGLWFLDRRHGFVCGEDHDGDGLLLETRDGGTSWAPVAALAEPSRWTPLTQVVFGDERHGFVVGGGDGLWRTADGGRTWLDVEHPDLAAFGVFLLDGLTGWILSQTLTDDFDILRTQHWLTADAGKTLEPLGDLLEDRPLRLDVAACAFWDRRDGILCGPQDLLLATADGGRTWRRSRAEVPRDLNFFALAGDRTAYAFGEGGLALRTDDRGATWRRLPTGTEHELHASAFTDPDSGFVVGEAGTVLWTRDGGRTFHSGVVQS